MSEPAVPKPPRMTRSDSRMRRMRTWAANGMASHDLEVTLELHQPKVGIDGSRLSRAALDEPSGAGTDTDGETPEDGEGETGGRRKSEAAVDFAEFLYDVLDKTDETKPVSIFDFLSENPHPVQKDNGKEGGVVVKSEEQDSKKSGKGKKEKKSKRGSKTDNKKSPRDAGGEAKPDRRHSKLGMRSSKSWEPGSVDRIKEAENAEKEKTGSRRGKKSKQKKEKEHEKDLSAIVREEEHSDEFYHDEDDIFVVNSDKLQGIVSTFRGLEGRLTQLDNVSSDLGEENSPNSPVPKDRARTTSLSDAFTMSMEEREKKDLLEFLYLNESQGTSADPEALLRSESVGNISNLVKKKVPRELPVLRRNAGLGTPNKPKTFGSFVNKVLEEAPEKELPVLREFLAPTVAKIPKRESIANQMGEVSEWSSKITIDVGDINDWNDMYDVVERMLESSKKRGASVEESSDNEESEPKELDVEDATDALLAAISHPRASF